MNVNPYTPPWGLLHKCRCPLSLAGLTILAKGPSVSGDSSPTIQTLQTAESFVHIPKNVEKSWRGAEWYRGATGCSSASVSSEWLLEPEFSVQRVNPTPKASNPEAQGRVAHPGSVESGTPISPWSTPSGYVDRIAA